MNAKEFLLQPERIRKEIERRRMRIVSLRQLAERLTAAMQEIRVMSSPDPTRMESLLAEAADEEKQVARLEDEAAIALAEVSLAVSALPDIRMVKMLEMRYLDGCRWDEIQARLRLSPSRVFKLHRRALDLMEKRGGAEEKNCVFFGGFGL